MKELKVERLKLKQHLTVRGRAGKSGSITPDVVRNFTPEDFCYGVLKGMSNRIISDVYDYSERNRHKDQQHDWFREWTEKKSGTV